MSPLTKAESIEATGFPDTRVMHGLRKTVAHMLAEAACSAPNRVTGDRSPA
jgi:hypothetical protein